jgi:peptidoglycan/LPS O-acetylase OafA/YrhL
MSNDKPFLSFLDGIRGIATLSVFLVHSFHLSFKISEIPWRGPFRDFKVPWSHLLVYPLSYGSAGVAIFFCVSGFCIHLSYQRNKDQGWIAFFIRRFFRIFPAYVIALLIFLYIWPVGPKHSLEWKRVQLITHVLAIHNFDGDTLFGINPAFWSIAVEIQLYLIYPLLIIFAAKYGLKAAMIAVGTIELSIRFAESYLLTLKDASLPLPVLFSPFAFWLSWAIGAYTAECMLAGRASIFSRIRMDFMLLIAILLPLFKLTAPFAFLAYSLATAVCIDKCLAHHEYTPRTYLGRKSWEHLSRLGVVSYSFYLIHQPILIFTRGVVKRIAPSMSGEPLFLLAICLCWYPLVFLISMLSFRYLEQRFIRIGHAVSGRLIRVKTIA